MLAGTARLGWDADGVVLDSRAAAWRGAQDIAGLFGERPQIASPGDNARFFGSAAQVGLAGEDGAPVLRAMHRILMRSRAQEVGLFGDVLDIVAALAEPPALITAAYAAGIRAALGRHADLFATIVGRESGHKEALLAAAATKGMRWFITDTARDLRRCRACGIAVIAVGWGYDAAADIAGANPDIYVETPAELARALAGLSFLQPR